jgi:superfamily I DNA/RNA helicase/RecB family exonuclease
MTPMALAYAILRRQAVGRGEPAPLMITGPEQDAILADLLAGHARGEGVAVSWPESMPPQARALRAFRHELRDLMMRAAERDVDPVALDDLGREHRVPEWRAAAVLYQEYLDVQALRGSVVLSPMRYDAAALVASAAQALRADPSWRPPWGLVVVDDYQEATAATRGLLRVLAERGVRVVVLGCPDIAVQTYRGARPDLIAEALDPLPGGFGAEPVALTTDWRRAGGLREGTALREATAGIVRHIRPGRAGGRARRVTLPAGGPAAPAAGECSAESVRTVVLASAAEEAAFVAHTLRLAHLRDGIAWGRMAVLTRSSSRIELLRSALTAAAVPAGVPGMEVPVRAESAAKPLLRALCLVSEGDDVTGEVVEELLVSPLGGLDAMAARKLRRVLRAHERSQGGGRASEELLVEAVTLPEAAAHLPLALREPVERLGHVIAAGRAAADEPGTDAELVLWALWDATGLDTTWQSISLMGGAGAERADRDLDAVVALMDAARRYAERRPGASAASFAEAMGAQDVPSDTLAPRALGERVTIGTAAFASGHEWDLVVVTGVQEGVWPDLRLRDTLLGAGRLADLVDGRGGVVDPVEQRRAILDDELRSFALACSRARRRLVVTAILTEEERPSEFCSLLGRDLPRDRDGRPAITSVPLPLDLRGLVAQARAETVAGDDDAARLVAALAAAGVPGADPEEWAGLIPDSTTEPLHPPGATVKLSPSRVEALATCPLRWALEGAGGRPASGTAQSVGVIVHGIAERNHSADSAQLMEEFDAEWAALGVADTWQGRREYSRGKAMIEALAVYNAEHGAPLDVETPFAVEAGRVRLIGRIDRVEAASSVPGGSETGVRIVDFKTSAMVPSAADAQLNPQLGVYQLAVDLGALDGALAPGLQSEGAALVYLGKATASGAPTARTQAPLSAEDNWVGALLDQCAVDAAAATFAAVANPTCRHCAVAPCCPVHELGRQVTA